MGDDGVGGVPRPGKIVGVGRNYADHARELGHDIPAEPLLFLKPPSAVIGDGDPILLPSESQQVEYEGELVVIVGTTLRDATEADAAAAIAGYACGNDVTARDLQRSDPQWTRAKGFDSFAAMGPGVISNVDVTDVAVVTRVNGEVRQSGRTSQLIFSVPQLLSFISGVMTLEPGDAVYTGTPAGVGQLHDGDVVEVEIDGLGILRNPVRRRTRSLGKQ